MSETETRVALGTLGVEPQPDGRTCFRVWAPEPAGNLALSVDGRRHELTLEDGGTRVADVDAAPGADYAYLLAGDELPDPCSRSQPHGVRGPSRVVDTSAFEIAPFGGVALDDLVIYELHVGTFSREGTFDGVVPHLERIQDLGVTAIELMPVATFPGNRNWGYDGVYTSAPHPAYGGPEGLARLVDGAHRAGLAVVLDVVYNHIGPGSERIAALAPYFTPKHTTFWGDALDYSERGVREWAIQNAELWIRDYRIDGLRLDATHAIFDDSPRHVLAELNDRVKQANSAALVISEMEPDDWRPVDEWGHDAQWADRAHHELHILLTGERDGYYAAYAGSVDELGRDLRGLGHPPRRLVVCAQNHDQVGNRALGDRLPADALRIAAAVTLFSPCTPLLFMGEEYGERAPFQFFTDHIDPFIADATREGRRREFAEFSGFSAGDVPDPQDPETFERSKLTHEEDPETRAFYERLLRLRRELPRETEITTRGETLTMRRGRATLTADFAAKTVTLDA